MTERPCVKGFTLIELMVVIVILGMLVALVAPNVWRIEGESTIRIARAQMHNLAGAIQQYFLERRELPPTLEVLTLPSGATGEPFIESIPKDPWHQAYEYKPAGKRQFRLASFGEDRVPGTEDDLVYPPKDAE